MMLAFFARRDQLLPKHPMAEAVGYALNQWNELNVFTTDGADLPPIFVPPAMRV